MTNLPSTISTLNQQIGALTEKLAPVTDEQVTKGIRSLLAAGLSLPSNMQADKVTEIYGFALSGVSGFAFQKAIGKIIRGEYEINRSFVPTPPELSAMARAESKVIREDRARLQDRVDAISVPAQQSQVSEAGRARIRKILAGFRQNHAATKASGMVHEMPMSADQAGYYQRIMAMKDAPGIGAEQLAYRAAIQRKVEGSSVQPDTRIKE